jgi:predicted permease
MNMRTLRWRLLRFKNLFDKKQLDRELSDELSSHLELHIADNLRSGMSPEQARRAALLKLGGVEQTKEACRERRGLPLLESVLKDLRFGLRMLRKNPGFTVIAILTLALGIGANTAIFSVVNTVLLRSLPFPHASQIVNLSARSTMFDFPYLGLSLPDITDVRARASTFALLAIDRDSPKEISGEGKPERVEGTEVTEDFFPVLGIRPLCGRTFTSADMQAGNRTVVLSDSLWRDRFGGDPAAIGKSITLDGQPHTIIGVIPAQPELGFATDSKFWTPLVTNKEQLAARDDHSYPVLARLKPRTTIEQAQNELDIIGARLETAYPDVDKGWSIHATPLKRYLLGDARTPLIVLFAAVGFVLLIACANVSNLFLSRGWPAGASSPYASPWVRHAVLCYANSSSNAC